MADTLTISAERTTEPVFKEYRHNALAFVLDSGFFHIAVTFIGATTVLPSFVAALSDSEVMVGLASGLISGGWLLPQLLVASAVAHLPRKKPLVVRAAWLSRPILLLVAFLVWQFGGQYPGVALAATMLGVFVFFVFDAVVSIPWFELLAKCLPARRRGRVVGTSQVLGGLGGIGAGIVVRYILGESSPLAFPSNYAFLFALGGLLFMVSAAFLMLIREPESHDLGNAPPTPRQVLASMPGILLRDREFRRLILIKLLQGFASVANAFYVLHATRNLGLSLGDTGLFVSAQVLGSVTAGLLMGVVQDHWGPWAHIRLIIVLTALPPLVALGAQPLLGILGQQVLYVYISLFFFLGIATGSIGWPFFNWIMEHAQGPERPVYIGMSNTLSALVMLAPTLGGWVAKTFSYPAVFGLALGFILASWCLSAGLRNPRVDSAPQPYC
ncbi:MAG: MFS transporter [Chloroflexi bacterium]|nr:MFS transporter [Chloroflexota bacterium]